MLPLAAFLLLAASPAADRAPSLQLAVAVDASEAPRRILRTRVVVPAAAGPFTFVYPKWIPGEHSPSGPIDQMMGLRVMASGKPLTWRRAPDDMFAFTCDVPPGARAIEVSFDMAMPAGVPGFTAASSASARLAVLSWHHLMVYPKGARASDLKVAARLTLATGWRHATALRVARQAGPRVEFQPVSLETLVDSPVLTGADLRTFDLSPGAQPPHALHLAADGAAALELPADTLRAFRRLVTETGALFGSRPYRRYDFLVSLSDHLAHFGLEHHESSDNRMPERTFLEDHLRLWRAGLLPHEMVHSWNGKHRRPAELATADFHQPMRGELLWIYEGLTTYLGEVLTARSGLRTAEQQREALAISAAVMAATPGRSWRPLADTAVAAQVLYGRGREWRSWRRGADFYAEGALVWLEADALIRDKTAGKRSLDDFCRLFHGGAGGAPSVRTYRREDVVAALGAVLEHDWGSFFASRIDAARVPPPVGGLARSGWRLVYQEAATATQKAFEKATKTIDLTFSIGLSAREDGTIADVLPGSPAAAGGAAPASKIVAVNERRFTPDVLRDAVRATKTKPDLELLIEHGDYFKTVRVRYRGGARHPNLVRDPARADHLSAILAPRAP